MLRALTDWVIIKYRRYRGLPVHFVPYITKKDMAALKRSAAKIKPGEYFDPYHTNLDFEPIGPMQWRLDRTNYVQNALPPDKWVAEQNAKQLKQIETSIHGTSFRRERVRDTIKRSIQELKDTDNAPRAGQ